MSHFQIGQRGAGALKARYCTEEDFDELLVELARLKTKLCNGSNDQGLDCQDSEVCGAAQDILRFRRQREKLFGAELFGDPAWDILLELYAAEDAGRKLSISGACYASAVPPTTALRWILKLERDCLVRRIDDPVDKRRSWLVLTQAASEKMRKFLGGVVTPHH